VTATGAAPAALAEPAVPVRARWVGLLVLVNIANSAPQVLGPVLAAPIVVYLGGYPVLHLLTAVVTLLGSVLVGRIRSVA
jgi:hypothetical protein